MQMDKNFLSPFLLKTCLLLLQLHANFAVEVSNSRDQVEPGEYCLSETFHPRCLKNEVILLKSAIYGRMRIGRCLTAEEVDAHRSVAGEDPRYFRCEADVSSILDRKCSGKAECEIRVFDIAAENVKPCFPGLSVYLETSYDCINVADETRSCVVDAAKTPVHVVVSKLRQRICGSISQPWIIEAPVGQKVSISILEDFETFLSRQTEGQSNQPCSSYGIIVDKAGKKNTSICSTSNPKQRKLYLSTGNSVDIYFHFPMDKEINSGDVTEFILKFEAVGCTDLVPPEDAYVKRNGDAIVIGCYSSRKTWHLHCQGGKWTGVIGNCSQGFSGLEPSVNLEPQTGSLTNEQVLTVVAVGGFTLALCLAIICLGAVCLRRFYTRSKNDKDYKTVNYHFESSRNQNLPSGIPTKYAGYNLNGSSTMQPMPTYSVYAGENQFSDVDNNTNTNERLQ